MDLDQIGTEHLLAGLREDLSALQSSLRAIEETRREMRRSATAFEAEAVSRLGALEDRLEDVCSSVEGRLAVIERSIAEPSPVQALGPQVETALVRLGHLEERLVCAERAAAEAQQFVKRIQGLRLLRARRTILQRVRG